MAVFSRSRPAAQSHRDAIVAAARKLDLSSTKEAEAQRKRGLRPWQAQSWDAYDQIGEIWFAHNYVANALRRIRLYPALRENPAEDPVALDPEPEDGDADPRAATCVTELSRLHSQLGGQAQIVADIGLNFGVAGDGYLVGRTIDTEDGPTEDWGFYSCDQVIAEGAGKWNLRMGPDDRDGEPLGEDAVVIRLWQPHPRWHGEPDCAMRAILGVSEELLLLTRKIRGNILASLNNGIMTVPTELVPPGKEVDDFIEDLSAAMMAPIADPDDPLAVVPNFVSGAGAYLDQMRHIVFERPVDEKDREDREELLGRIANGLDLPREVVLGLSSTQFSRTSWQIDDQTFKAHLEPKLLTILAALTDGWYRPALREAGVDGWEEIEIWYDPSAVVGEPNEVENAQWAHEHFLISDERTRRALNFGDEDAPDDDELAQRLERSRQPEPPPEAGPPATNGEAPNGQAALNGHAPLAQYIPALTAAAEPLTLGAKLTAMDVRLRTRLQVAADAAVNRALERAGARLRQKLPRNGKPDLRAQVSGVENAQVAATLGPAAVQSVLLAGGMTEDELLDEEWAGLSALWFTWVGRDQDRIRELALAEGATFDEEVVAQQQAEDTNSGWLLLGASLGALTRERLYTPAVEVLGEVEAGITVPAGIIRGALSRAGGADGTISKGGAALDASGHPLGELATGKRSLELLKTAGITVSSLVWRHGDPARPFPPHAALDGQTLSSWTDIEVVRPPDEEAWLGTTTYHPGDHAGCTCVIELVLTKVPVPVGVN